jgi:uncharacterized protein YgiM (DUF1202 family)
MADSLAHTSSSHAADMGERQVDFLLTTVSHLRAVAQEALEASSVVGTPTGELQEAQQLFAGGEQSFQQGKAAHAARQYRTSWEQLRASETAFRRSEEAAVRAGLAQLERELVANYGRFHGPVLEGRRSSNTLRVSQGGVNLRDGAGVNFQVIGKVQLGDTLNLLAESGEWYRVRAATGIVGWVSKNLVTRVPVP